MKRKFSNRILALTLIGGLAAIFLPPAQAQTNNQITPAETAAGWKLLFDGKSNAGWIRPNGSAGKFTLEDSALKTGGGDICTQDDYQDFEISIDYKYNAGGNSGIFLRTKRGIDPPWLSGMEVAIEDNGKKGNLYKNGDAAIYDILAPSKDMWTGPMKWNHLGVWLVGNHLEHWQNGAKVIEADMKTPKWTAMVADSKYVDAPFPENHWGEETKGQICLQDHGGDLLAWFRNIKVRVVDPAAPVPAPVLTPLPGDFATATTVSILTGAVGAETHYTTDGSAPSAASPLYSAPIAVAKTQTLKAISIRAGSPASTVAGGTYRIAGTALIPRNPDFRFSVGGDGSEVGLTLEQPASAAIRVDLQGTDGKLVKSARLEPGSRRLSIGSVKPGVYLLLLTGPGIKAQRLIIR